MRFFMSCSILSLVSTTPVTTCTRSSVHVIPELSSVVGAGGPLGPPHPHAKGRRGVTGIAAWALAPLTASYRQTVMFKDGD